MLPHRHPDGERVAPQGGPSPVVDHDAPTALSLPSMAQVPTAPPAPKYPFLLQPERADELGRLAHYRVLKLLGEGGMGLVFKAEDLHLQRPVALKVMLPERAKEEEAHRRFLREARAAAKLTHDHIVSIHQVGEANGVPFIAMSYLRGMTLGGFLEKYQVMTPLQIVRVGREAALGLAAAHKCGLIHRDIKPDNIWLEAPNGRVKLLDFGLARPRNVSKQLTESGFIVGTPQFMSPEQARNLPLDARSDLFSLGSVLYRLCAGKLAFSGDTLMATLTALAVDEPEPVGQLNPGLPPALTQLIHELLAKNPNERPPNAEEVAVRLAALEWDLAQGLSRAGEMKLPARRSWAGGPPDAEPAAPRLHLPTEVLEEQSAKPSAPESATMTVPLPVARLWPVFLALGIVATVIAATVFLVIGLSGEGTATKPAPPAALRSQRAMVGHLRHVRWVAVSPDGQVVASASFDGTARLWDMSTGGIRMILRGHRAGVEAIAFFPKEPKVATASYDGTVKIWDVNSGACLQTLDVFAGQATVTGLGISPDGKLLACGGGDRLGRYDIHLFDTVSGDKKTTLKGLTGHVTCAEFSPDGRFLAVCGVDAVIHVWDTTSEREQHILRGHAGEIEHASFSSDGKLLASASRDGTLRVWDMTTGKEQRRMAAPLGFWCVRFAPDGATVASAGINGEVRLWNALTGELRAVLAGHRGTVFHVAFAPDGRTLASSGQDNTVHVWDVSRFRRN